MKVENITNVLVLEAIENTVENTSIDSWFNELNNPVNLRTTYERRK